MPLQDISQVAISLNTSGISRLGFGTPLFLMAHNYNTDRVRSYSDITSIANDQQTTSNGYAAGGSCFGNTPSVKVLKIGRIIADSLVAPQVTDEDGLVITGTTTTITIVDQNEDSVTASYTTIGGDTVADVVDALVATINGGSLDINVTDNGDTFTIARATAFASGGDFTLSDIDNALVTAPTAGQESPVDALTAITEADADWYALAWENHTDFSGISAIITYINAVEKLYFIGSSALETIKEAFTLGGTPSATDIVARVADLKSFRAVTWWHQDADTTFNELAFAGYNLPFDAGSVTWANLKVAVSNAKNDAGNKLTTTQEQNLADRYCNWPSISGGIVYTREGKVSGNEWIDNIHGRDNLQSDIKADMFDMLTNQQGGKVPYTNKGINIAAGLLEKRLNFYKSDRGFLTDPITITVPKAEDIPRSEKITRILEGMSFIGTIAGAIQLTEIRGTLEP